MTPTLRIASSVDEREAVYRLRYETYVQEMLLFASTADHLGRRLTDPLDATARLLYASLDGKVVGTVRIHHAADTVSAAQFEETYSLSRFADCAQRTEMLVVSMLTTHLEFRETDLALELLRGVARIAAEETHQIVFVAPQPHLLNLYFGLGFRSYGSRVYNDPELGVLVPLALLPGDLEYLTEIRSPLAPEFRSASLNNDRVACLILRLGRGGVQRIGEADAATWSAVYARLADARRSGPRFLDGLDVDEVRALAAHGHVISCRPGDRIIRKGQIAQNVMVILSGNLEVREGERILAVAVPGDAVGELAFLLGARRTADVFAGRTGAEVLNLDESTLHRLVENPSRIAAVLLLNLSRSLARKLAETTALLQPPGAGFFPGGGLF